MCFLKRRQDKGEEWAHDSCDPSTELPCLNVSEGWGGQAQWWLTRRSLASYAARSFSFWRWWKSGLQPGTAIARVCPASCWRGDTRQETAWITGWIHSWLQEVGLTAPCTSPHSAIAMKTLAFCFPLSEHIAPGKPCDSSLPSTLCHSLKGRPHGHYLLCSQRVKSFRGYPSRCGVSCCSFEMVGSSSCDSKGTLEKFLHCG